VCAGLLQREGELVMSTRGIGRTVGNTMVAGMGDLASSSGAYDKAEKLKMVQQKHFQDTSDYDKSSNIAVNDPLMAIRYARSKKLTKSFRKGVTGAIKFGGFTVGAVTGATVGSVVPVAGTVAGGAIGGVTIGAAVSGGVTVLDQLKRKTKGLYKAIKGTRGEHRHQAAECLHTCANYSSLNNYDPKRDASKEALEIILEDEHAEVMGLEPHIAIERIADRLKSN
jgi:hypothetical protein